MNIEDKLWEKVRGWFHYPPLHPPEVEPKLEGGAHLDFTDTKVRVGESFVREMETLGLSEKECLEGLLTHEVGHYMVFPRNLATLILSGKMLDDFFKDDKDQETPNFIFQTYADINDDVASVLDGNKREPILKMRTASQQTIPDECNQNIRDVMLAYLHRQSGKEYQLKKELKPYLERMMTIEFLDPETSRPPKDAQKLRLSLFQWGDIVQEMVKKYAKGGAGRGRGQGEGNFGMPNDASIEGILGKASRKEIKKALREIIGQISRGEYKQVKEWLKDKGYNTDEGDSSVISIGTSQGELEISREVADYYKEWSRKYPIITHKKPIPSEKIKKSFESVEKWRINQEPLLAQPNLSGGMFLPGITRKIKINQRQIKTVDYALPHLLVVIDSSGSMPRPADKKSYSVLGAICTSRSYHLNDSAIGVINYSGGSFFLPYTRDLDEAIAGICAYQGGGTTIDLELMKKMLSPEEYKIFEMDPEKDMRRVPKEAIKKNIQISVPVFKKALEANSIDTVIFTDGGISNLEEVVQFLEDTQSVNRGTIVLSHGYDQAVPILQRSKINICHAESEEDIPYIAVKEAGRNIANYGKKIGS